MYIYIYTHIAEKKVSWEARIKGNVNKNYISYKIEGMVSTGSRCHSAKVVVLMYIIIYI